MVEINVQLCDAIDKYPTTWNRIISEWRNNQEDHFWLTYSANYLLNTAGVRWGLDPFSLFSRIGMGKQPDFSEELSELQLVVLTHNHSDHLDLELIHAIREKSIIWIIPDFMVERVRNAVDLNYDQILIPVPNKTMRIGNLSLTPFPGLHSHGEQDVPSMGYLVEFNNKRWLFPGDTRTYDFSRLPNFGRLDGVVGHLWLGKGEALLSKPSRLGEFCNFFSQFETDQLVITHIREFGREPSELWDLRHFHLVKSQLYDYSPELKISAALMGDRIQM